MRLDPRHLLRDGTFGQPVGVAATAPYTEFVPGTGVAQWRREENEMKSPSPRPYLLASDFDCTLSVDDSGEVLARLLGIPRFAEKVAGLARSHLVHQGAELTYLLCHDPEFRIVRREHLREVGRRIRLKDHVGRLVETLAHDLDGVHFEFFVISAAPRELVQSALATILPPENILGAEFSYDEATGEIAKVVRVPAGYGKIVALQELVDTLGISPDRIVYVGDGSSDLYAMHHVNSRVGFTIAVSDTKFIGRVARRTVLSESALSVLVPILEEVLHWTPQRIRDLFVAQGIALHDWDKISTDWLSFYQWSTRYPPPL
jgi:phosphoserine phosphatase